MSKYLQNTWYRVAWAGELPAIGVLARTVLEPPLADLLSLRPALQRPDVASTRARRILEQLIAEEEGTTAMQPHERRRAQPPAT